MANPLYNRYGNGNVNNNILQQYQQVKNNPGMILDILLQNKKINYQQYSEMQSFKDNPQQIVNYLINHSNM